MDPIKLGVAVVDLAGVAVTAFAADHNTDKLDDVKKAVGMLPDRTKGRRRLECH
ncbi:hypothetical protein BH11PLA2_BH11PLA2_33170 [soil metagenome]